MKVEVSGANTHSGLVLCVVLCCVVLCCVVLCCVVLCCVHGGVESVVESYVVVCGLAATWGHTWAAVV